MKNTIGKILSMSLIAISLAACGSSTTAGLASTSSVTGTGSSSIASGLIGFTGEAGSNDFGYTTLLIGQLPAQLGTYGGTHGQVSVGAATAVANATSSIQYTQKSAGVNGQFTLYGSLISNSQMTYSGTIQLSSTIMQEIEATFGSTAQVTQVGIWVIQDLMATSSSYYTGSTNSVQSYAGPIEQVEAWLYINGATTPVGPIIF